MQKNTSIEISFLVALFPVLAIYYAVPGISLASFLLWLNIIIIFIARNRKIDFCQDEVKFFYGVLTISFLSAFIHLVRDVEWFDFVLFWHNLFSITLYLFPLCFVPKLIDENVFVKTVLVFGTIASLVLIWQYTMLIFTGSFQNNLFIPWLNANHDVDTLLLLRPSSFFTEPAHFSIYILPAFQVALTLEKNIFAYLFAFAILCSGSSTGFVLLGLLISYHIIRSGSKNWYKALFAILVISLAALVLFFVTPDVFTRNIDKLELVNQGRSESRLLGPLVYLGFFQFYEHFLGLTLNQLGTFSAMNNFFSYGALNYANALIYMYISYGIIGSILFLWYITKKIKQIKTSYGMIIVFLGVVCSDQILFNAHFFYLVCFVLMNDKISNTQISFFQRSK